MEFEPITKMLPAFLAPKEHASPFQKEVGQVLTRNSISRKRYSWNRTKQSVVILPAFRQIVPKGIEPLSSLCQSDILAIEIRD